MNVEFTLVETLVADFLSKKRRKPYEMKISCNGAQSILDT